MTGRLGVLAILLSAAAALGEDWKKTLTPHTPGGFPAMRPLHSTYRFGWAAFEAATADLDFSRTPDGLLKLEMTTKTTGAVRSMWRLDARHIAFTQAATLSPVSVRQTEVYKDQTLKTTLDFDPSGVARLRESQPPDKNPARTKHFKSPALFDLHSALLFVRSQPLRVDDRIRLVVYPSTDPYLAEVEVLGRETIEILGKKQPALKLGLKLRRITKKLELAPHKKFKRATAWLSDDRDRLFLKIAAEISVGSVWAELESVEFKKP